MNCESFETCWQDLLDGVDLSPCAQEELDAHASQCESCREAHQGYLILARMVTSPRFATVPVSDDLADRVMRAWTREADAAAAGPVFLIDHARGAMAPAAHKAPRLLRLTLAASLLLAFVPVAVRFSNWHNKPKLPSATSLAANQPALHPPTPPLGEALARTTEATVELARATTAPAARLGRFMLASTPVDDATVPPDMVSGDRAGVVAPPEEPDTGWRDRVRPIMQPATSAFGFLLLKPTPASPPGDAAPRERDA